MRVDPRTIFRSDLMIFVILKFELQLLNFLILVGVIEVPVLMVVIFFDYAFKIIRYIVFVSNLQANSIYFRAVETRINY